MGILDEDVVRVREATDLVEFAREHLALKRVGRRYSGLCPFHSEKSPSFTINPELGLYHCFGCGASGDAITFVREVEHLDFVGAVERLAQRAGIQLRYDDASQGRERSRRARLCEAVAAAIDFYHQRLLTSADAGRARQYVRSRGFDKDAVQRFKLGYSPPGWDELTRALNAQKFSRDDLVASGLSFVNSREKLTDVFRNRLMFPIWDQRGDAVGFGARTLTGDDGPKYKNSAENAIYQKSKLLYGLNLAKADVVARGEVVICEGYTDVMAFHLAGVTNAVATCGTALADDHFVALKNLARRIVLAYDADAAGQAAAEKCYTWEQKFEVQFAVADLPAGLDPGDLWRDDRERLPKAIEHATPFLEFRIDRVMDRSDMGTFEGRARAAKEACAIVAEHPEELVRDQYAMRVADRLEIDVERIRRAIAEARRRGPSPTASSGRTRARGDDIPPPPDDDDPRPVRVSPLELDALRFAVHHSDVIGSYLDESLFGDRAARAIFRLLAESESIHDAIEVAPRALQPVMQRLAVEDPAESGDITRLVQQAVVNLVMESSQRVLRSMVRHDDERSIPLAQLRDSLARERELGNWDAAVGVADELVGWISAEFEASSVPGGAVQAVPDVNTEMNTEMTNPGENTDEETGDLNADMGESIPLGDRDRDDERRRDEPAGEHA